MNKKQPNVSIAWHCLLGEVLEKLLSPVGLLVYTELPVMNKPPKADILIIRREQTSWTEEQLQRLPDGVRDSQAPHLLLEFKYTESLTKSALQQALAYDYFYKQAHELADSEVQTFLLCAKQPQSSHLTEYGYVKTSVPGVYCSQWSPWLPSVMLLSLNELSDAPHNTFVKCFASQLKEKRKAFKVLWQLLSTWEFPGQLVLFLDTLWKHWFPSAVGGTMKSQVTASDFNNLSHHWKQLILSTLTIEDMLACFKPEDILAQFKPEDVLAQFKPEDVLAHIKPEEIEIYLAQLKKTSRVEASTAKTRKKDSKKK